MKKPKVCTLGSMTIDIFIKPNDTTVIKMCREKTSNEEYIAFPYGGKIHASETHELFGGGANNTCVGLSRLGFNASPVAQIGDDIYGEKLIENLKKELVSIENMQIAKNSKEHTGVSVILRSFEGERTVFYYPGTNKTFSDFNVKILDDVEGLFFNHISARGNNADVIFQSIKRHFLKYPKKFLFWNPGKEQISQGALSFIDFFPVVDVMLLNKEEAEAFTGRKARKRRSKKSQQDFPHSAADYSEIFQVFMRQGVQNVVITDGRNGSQICDGKNIYFCGIDEVSEKIDTLGAGDGFGTGLFYAIFHKKKLHSSLKYATINAASVVSQVGSQTGLLTEKGLLSRLKKASFYQAQQKFSL